MTTKQEQALHDAFISAPTPAAAARVMGIDGKALRGALRRAGVYVSQNRDAYDTDAREALFVVAQRMAARKATPDA